MSRYSGRVMTLVLLSLTPLSLAILPAAGQAPQPRGVPPRATPADYVSHIDVGGVGYGACLLSPDQVKHTFAFDISKSYLVFEVAIYPGDSDGQRIALDPEGFVIRTASMDLAHPSDPVTVASDTQQKNSPRHTPNAGNVTVATRVGYESGRDPYTGQKVHGTYTSSEVGVQTSPDDAQRYPAPGGDPQDRQLLENQLWEKSLPQAEVKRPIAGYLYFPASLVKKPKDGIYHLEYLGAQGEDADATAPPTGKVALAIPAAKH